MVDGHSLEPHQGRLQTAPRVQHLPKLGRSVVLKVTELSIEILKLETVSTRETRSFLTFVRLVMVPFSVRVVQDRFMVSQEAVRTMKQSE